MLIAAAGRLFIIDKETQNGDALTLEHHRKCVRLLPMMLQLSIIPSPRSQVIPPLVKLLLRSQASHRQGHMENLIQ